MEEVFFPNSFTSNREISNEMEQLIKKRHRVLNCWIFWLLIFVILISLEVGRLYWDALNC